jgi:hypothetical protein
MQSTSTKKLEIVQLFRSKWTASVIPPDLDTLVKGIEAQGGKRLRYQ